MYLLSAKANTKCWSCMKVDENNVTRPWACGQDGAKELEETCGDRVIGCVSEHGENSNNRDRLNVSKAGMKGRKPRPTM